MTQHADLLATLAQIFIAFAGFTGVVVVLGRFRPPSQTSAYRARLILAVSLLALLASLVPLVFDAGGLPADAINRLAASFLASGGIAVGLWDWQRPRPRSTTGRLNTRLIMAIRCSIATALVAALFAVGAGFFPTFAPAIFIAALFFCAVLSAFYFFTLIVAVAVDVGERG